MSFSGEAAVESRVPQLFEMAGERVNGAAANPPVPFCPLSDVYKPYYWYSTFHFCLIFRVSTGMLSALRSLFLFLVIKKKNTKTKTKPKT